MNKQCSRFVCKTIFVPGYWILSAKCHNVAIFNVNIFCAARKLNISVFVSSAWYFSNWIAHQILVIFQSSLVNWFRHVHLIKKKKKKHRNILNIKSSVNWTEMWFSPLLLLLITSVKYTFSEPMVNFLHCFMEQLAICYILLAGVSLGVPFLFFPFLLVGSVLFDFWFVARRLKSYIDLPTINVGLLCEMLFSHFIFNRSVWLKVSIKMKEKKKRKTKINK